MIVHLTTAHPRHDIRIFHKMSRGLTSGPFTLLVADGLGNRIIDGVSIVDIGKAKSRLSRILFTPWYAANAIRKKNVQLIHFHDPEFLLPALWLKFLGFVVVYDVHEDVPRQILSKPWLPGTFRKPISWVFEQFENFAAKKMSAIVTATSTIADRFRPFSIPVTVVHNYPISAEFVTSKPALTNNALCYIGGISRVRGIDQLIQALSLLPDFTLTLAGRFQPPSLQSELELLPGWAQVDYRGEVDRNEITAILENASIGVATLLPIENYLDSLPIKMFEYMASGLPVLASNFPLWQRLVEDTGAGICVDPQNPKAIAVAVLNLMKNPSTLQEMGTRGKELIKKKYNWDTQLNELLRLYRKLGIEVNPL